MGAGAISLRVALVIGSVSEFLGCLLMGGEVAKTVGKGVVHLEEWDQQSDLLAIAMTAVLAGAGISTASATAFGLPVSATHGAISGLTGVAIYERGTAAVNGSGLAFTVFGWVLSPLIGGLVGGGLCALIDTRSSARQTPQQRHTKCAQHWWRVLWGSSWCSSARKGRHGCGCPGGETALRSSRRLGSHVRAASQRAVISFPPC